MTAKELRDRLLSAFPESRPRLTEFPSGAFMLDLEIHGVPYVAEYIAGHGFGLSKTRAATFGWEGVETAFSNIQALADHIFIELSRKKEP